jgi:Pectate lyase superfamily protein
MTDTMFPAPVVDKGLGYFNVKNYGALGDGTTNDTAAIQAAWNAVPAAGGTVYYPQGLYQCTGQLTQPVGSAILHLAASRGASVLRYAGVTDQPFIILPGQNQGTTFRSLAITGNPADPCVQILGSGGSGTNGYQSLVTFDDCEIGDRYTAGSGAAAGEIAQIGITAQCDVFAMVNCAVWGRNGGLRLELGTTDAYLTNCSFSSLPQGGEARAIGLWCSDVTNIFSGMLFAVNCTFANGTEAACFVRSIVNLIGCYVENSPLPLKANNAILNVIGGKYATANTGATTLMSLNNSQGTILNPYMSAPSGANSLTSLINCTNSPVVNAWTITGQSRSVMVGTLPTTLLVCDQPYIINWQGVAQKTLSIQQPTFATSYTPDPTLGRVRMTLTGNITVNNPTVGLLDGTELTFEWRQDGTGTRTVTYGGNFKTGGRPAMNTGANTYTVDRFQYDSTNGVWHWYAGVTGQ